MDRHTRHIRFISLLLLLSSFFVATASSERVVVTSGRVVYDAFGRSVAVYCPTVDRLDVTVYSDTVDAVPPTATEYDVLDRPVKVIYPDSTRTSTVYRIVGQALMSEVTDAKGRVSETHVNGSGLTVKSVRVRDDGERQATSFAYDGIGRMVSVTDAEGNVTSSVYDMADRLLKMSHPASGETTFTYDALGNVLTRQTANLRDSATFIVYGYDRGRLVSVTHPGHPEDSVRYYYGSSNDGSLAKGRVCFREDATGGIQYSYDKMGNVSETLRTVVVPNDPVGLATFLTKFKYDSFGKLLSMTYPDGEHVCYWYDGSGQLTFVYIDDLTAGYKYVADIGYDKFGDRVYMEYGNGAKTEYAYDCLMRRLDTLSVSKSDVSPFSLARIYSYDEVGNVTELSSSDSWDGLLYPPVRHTYYYDDLYRLTKAYGNEHNPGSATGYSLTMSYDNMYRITGKSQHVWQTNIQFGGMLKAGYDLVYSYGTAPGKRFQMSAVSDVNYRTVGDSDENDHINEDHYYGYDPNGNILYVNTGRWKSDRTERDLSREERFRWDDENRLTAISQDGYVSNYWYDADGERVIKEHGGNHAVFVNSSQDSVLTDTRQFTIYPSPYLVVHNGNWYTNHIYVGSERVASRLGTMDYGVYSYDEDDYAGNNIPNSVNYANKCNALVGVMASNYAHFGLPYNALGGGGSSPAQNPSFFGSGVAGGLRCYWMMADGTDGTNEAGGPGRAPMRKDGLHRGAPYFYHSDHLGSSLLITDTLGRVTQQVEYLPYGEVFLEKQRNTSDYLSPYRFNGKELDEETGLYYYGSRYMNPRLSIWYGTDPMQEKYPDISSYSYCAGNPINFVDFRGDSLIVAPEYQDLFNKALTDVFGDIISKGFVYDNNGVVSFNGDIKGMSKKQREIFNDFKKVLASKTITHIIYAERYNVKDKNGCIATIIPEITGGEGTLLACDYKNFTQNYVVINPLTSQEIKIYSVTDNYYKTYGTVPTPDSEPNFKIETIKTNVSNLTWHGIGHVIYGGKTQNKVLDFDNKVREIMNLPKRPYDQTHNKMITTNISGNVWGY